MVETGLVVGIIQTGLLALIAFRQGQFSERHDSRDEQLNEHEDRIDENEERSKTNSRAIAEELV